MAVKHIAIIVLILLVGGIGYWFYSSYKYYSDAYTNQPVHWHADVIIELCGKKFDLPRVGAGQHHRGLPLLHTHDDNKIHVEGQIFKREDIALGKFMDAVGVSFSADKIMDKKNSDLCSGKPAKVKMFVNDEPNEEFRDFVFVDGDIIRIVFEP